MRPGKRRRCAAKIDPAKGEPFASGGEAGKNQLVAQAGEKAVRQEPVGMKTFAKDERKHRKVIMQSVGSSQWGHRGESLEKQDPAETQREPSLQALELRDFSNDFASVPQNRHNRKQSQRGCEGQGKKNPGADTRGKFPEANEQFEGN